MQAHVIVRVAEDGRVLVTYDKKGCDSMPENILNPGDELKIGLTSFRGNVLLSIPQETAVEIH